MKNCPGPWQKVGYFRKVRISLPVIITTHIFVVHTIRPCRLEGPMLITSAIHLRWTAPSLLLFVAQKDGEKHGELAVPWYLIRKHIQLKNVYV